MATATVLHPSTATDAASLAQQQQEAVQLHNLQFTYPGCERALKDVTLDLPKGSRTLLLGANGAFKTTLLQLIAGKYMVGRDVIRVLQQSPFYDMVGAGCGRLGGRGRGSVGQCREWWWVGGEFRLGRQVAK